MRRLVAVVLLASCLAIAKDESEIVAQQDVPLQTTWFQPRKPAFVETKGWAFWRSKWAAYPVIGQRLDQSKKWMRLIIHGRTTNQLLMPCGIVINADGKELLNRAIEFSHNKGTWGDIQLTPNLGSADIDHLAIVRAIASSKEVWLTLLTCDGSTPSRASISLSPVQIDAFKNSISKFDGLKP